MRPMFDFLFPVLADAHDKIQWGYGTNSMEDHKVVAILSICIYWSYMIRDILPKGSTGILVAFESSCARKLTYEVNGPDVFYLGAEEYSDSFYDHMTIGSWVSDLRFYSNNPSTYSGLPLEDSYCPLYVTVRDSAKMEAVYTTNKPWIFALVTVFVFLVAVSTVILYNYVVEQRQMIVLTSAGTCFTNLSCCLRFWFYTIHINHLCFFYSHLQYHCIEPFFPDQRQWRSSSWRLKPNSNFQMKLCLRGDSRPYSMTDRRIMIHVILGEVGQILLL
jgi:hypothetical protein